MNEHVQANSFATLALAYTLNVHPPRNGAGSGLHGASRRKDTIWPSPKEAAGFCRLQKRLHFPAKTRIGRLKSFLGAADRKISRYRALDHETIKSL